MTRFRHDLILRLVKIMDAVLVTIPFALCWYLYYAKHIASPFYAKGDYLVVALFFVLFIMFGRVYDAFLMSMYRISEIVYAQFLAAAVSDFIMYVVIWLLSKHLPNILPGVAALVGQLVLAAIWARSAHHAYFKTFPPQATAVIYDTRQGLENFAGNLTKIDQGTYADVMQQVGGGNPLASGASYGGFVILWFAAFLSELGAKNKLKDVNIGMLLSAIFIFFAAGVCCVALIGHIDATAAADIPALVLAEQISPVVAVAFAIIICAGIYTSATPLLWTAVRKLADEGTVKYKAITVLAGAVGCGIACFVPYKELINVLYGLNGYLGFVLVFAMVAYDLKTKMSLKHGVENETAGIDR